VQRRSLEKCVKRLSRESEKSETVAAASTEKKRRRETAFPQALGALFSLSAIIISLQAGNVAENGVEKAWRRQCLGVMAMKIRARRRCGGGNGEMAWKTMAARGSQ